jgi:hypothetical protein
MCLVHLNCCEIDFNVVEFSGEDVGVMWENVIVFISCHSETHRGLIPSSSIMNVDIVERDDVSLEM